MKILIAIDSFKGSISSQEAANAIEQGIKNTNSSIFVIKKPIGDGGEGTTQALVDATNGQMISLSVNNPLFKPVIAEYGISGDSKCAFIEMATASGLPLININERNPLNTSTYGTGELIIDAVNRGVSEIIIGLGGSATNDAGIGMLSALGYSFFDKNGNEIDKFNCNGANLINIYRIDDSDVSDNIKKLKFRVACDVDNPFYGENGAAYIYGPQKGGTPEIIKLLDEGMKHFSKIIKEFNSKDISLIPGTGAAGGLGGAFLAFFNSELKSGIQLVIEYTKLEDIIKNVDVVITGEGRIDFQTVMGKAPIGIAKLAKKYNKITIGICGAIGENITPVNVAGIDVIFSIQSKPLSLEKAIMKDNTIYNLKLVSEQIFRLINSIKNKMSN